MSDFILVDWQQVADDAFGIWLDVVERGAEICSFDPADPDLLPLRLAADNASAVMHLADAITPMRDLTF